MQWSYASAVPREEICRIWERLPCDEEQGQVPGAALRGESYGTGSP